MLLSIMVTAPSFIFSAVSVLSKSRYVAATLAHPVANIIFACLIVFFYKQRHIITSGIKGDATTMRTRRAGGGGSVLNIRHEAVHNEFPKTLALP